MRHLELAAAAGLPVVIHTREAAADTLRLLDAHGAGVTVVLHCFSLPDRLPDLVERGYYLSFAGNVTYKNAPALQAAVREAPADRLLLETDAPFLTPVPYRGRPNSSALVVHTYEFVAARARHHRRRNWRGRCARTPLGPTRACGWSESVVPLRRPARVAPADVDGAEAATPRDASSAPRQTSLARLAEFGVVPKRSLGQNFLIDDNILGLILDRLPGGPRRRGDRGGCRSRRAHAGAGRGVGVRARVRDRWRPRPGPPRHAGVAARAWTCGRQRRGPCTRVILHFQDIMRAPLEALAPRPTLCASNLPYSVAAPFLAEAMTRLPHVRRYLRHGAARDRRPSGGHAGQQSVRRRVGLGAAAHAPGGRAASVPGHLLPEAARGLVAADARSPAGGPATRAPEVFPSLVLRDPVLVRRVIDGAFGQRRKTAVNALQAASGLPKETLAAALVAVGASAGARAEQLAPEQFAALADRLAQDWPR